MEPHWLEQLGWALLAWTATYVADYVSTILTARLYAQGASNHIVFEGSFELTPGFQEDVDRLRWFSRRFLIAWALGSTGLAAVWWLSLVVIDLPQAMAFLMGALLLREAAILLRHARNLLIFRRARQGGQLEGSLRYRRPLMLYLSAGELGSFAVFFALLGLALSSWFFTGGAVGCAVLGWQHLRLSQAADGT